MDYKFITSVCSVGEISIEFSIAVRLHQGHSTKGMLINTVFQYELLGGKGEVRNHRCDC